MTAAISAERVTKRFAHRTVLGELSLSVAASEIVGVIGPSGAGKSTLLRLLSGVERGHTGRLAINGRDVVGPNRSVGFMFQEPRLMPWLSVRDNIALALPPRMHARDADARIAALLAQVQLEGTGELLPRALSGGMAQRVALARCLAAKPSVILLDEPFSAVDALTRIALQELLLAIWQQTRLTLLLVTHDLDEALYLCDRVVVLAGSPATLRETIHVTAPRPRDRRAPELARQRAELMTALQVT